MKRIFSFIIIAVIALPTMAQKAFVYQNCGLNEQPTNGMIDGHEWVDLGLPSGTLWATCNVGANSPYENGNHYAWGETSPKTNYIWDTYKFGKEKALTKYCYDSNYGNDGYTDNRFILEPSDDAATVNWGENWRMPTKEEQEELLNECSWTSTNINGDSVMIVTGPNGNSIILPSAGYYKGTEYRAHDDGSYYWSSSLGKSSSSEANYLYYDPDITGWFCSRRDYGRSIRPVVMQPVIPEISTMSITPLSKVIQYEGGTFDISITTNSSWIAFSDQLWATMSSTSGVGNFTIKITITPNMSTVSDWATITIRSNEDGITKSVLITREGMLSVSGTIAGHDFVDLGLPSGTLWATCNVGTTSSEGLGDRFAWGETKTKSSYTWSNYKYGVSAQELTKYCINGKNGFSDGKNLLEAMDDAATTIWGTDWRTPTKDQLMELYAECIWNWTTHNGISGFKVIGPNGNSMFLPIEANGARYWSSSNNSSYRAFCIEPYRGELRSNYYERALGFKLRPVVNQ